MLKCAYEAKLFYMRFPKDNLENFGDYLESRDYIKKNGHYKTEDYGYWKSFEIAKDVNGNEKPGYQIGLLIYDFSKYPNCKDEKPYRVQYEFMLGKNEFVNRVDFSVSDDKMSPKDFEKLCAVFYHQFCKDYLFHHKPKTVQEAVKSIYESIKDDPKFIESIQTKTAGDFAIESHHGFGTGIRNDFDLWDSSSDIHKDCKARGVKHPDDMSGFIMAKLYDYAKAEIEKKDNPPFAIKDLKDPFLKERKRGEI